MDVDRREQLAWPTGEVDRPEQADQGAAQERDMLHLPGTMSRAGRVMPVSSPDEAQREGIAVRDAFVGLDGRNDDEHDRAEPDDDHRRDGEQRTEAE